MGGLTIKKPSDLLQAWGLCIGIYGKPGIGKTTLAGSVINSKHGAPAIILDAEGGSYVLAGKDVDVLSIASWADLQAVSREINVRGPKYATYIIDNMSEIQELHLGSVEPDVSKREFKTWNISHSTMLQFVRSWRDLSRLRGINVIFCIWEETDKEESTGRWVTRLGTTPKVSTMIPGILDYVGYLTKDEKSQERILILESSPKLSSKMRRPLIGPSAEIPGIIYKPDLGEILDVMKGDLKWSNTKHEPSNKP